MQKFLKAVQISIVLKMLSYQLPVWMNYRSYYMIESQNIWGWKGPLDVTWPILLASSWTTYSPGPCPDPLWVSPRIENPKPGNLCQGSVCLTVIKLFPSIQREPPVLQFVPISSGPINVQQWEKSGLDFFAQLLQIFIKIEPSLLKVIKSQLSVFPH